MCCGVILVGRLPGVRESREAAFDITFPPASLLSADKALEENPSRR